MPITVLLVDDHKLIVTGLADMIARTEGMAVAGMANSGPEALELIRQHQPDVVIVDIAMPGMDGIQLTRTAVTEFPESKIICLSMHGDPQLIAALFKAGASAYLMKDCDLSELLTAIEKVHAGETCMSASVLKIVTDAYRHEGDAPGHQWAASPLTEREREVLVMLADGMTTKQIASRLQLSIKTIGTYREHLMDKLNTRSLAGLIKYAIRQGLTSSD